VGVAIGIDLGGTNVPARSSRMKWNLGQRLWFVEATSTPRRRALHSTSDEQEHIVRDGGNMLSRGSGVGDAVFPSRPIS
jgi:hypothetical protein